MKKTILYFIIILSLFSICTVTTYAADRTSGIFTYELLSDGTAKITGFSGNFSGALTIPYKLNNGVVVTSVGAGAFRGNNNITKLTVEAGVETISAQAFRSCNSITDITIYEGVTYLGDYAFSGCNSVETMQLPASLADFENSSFGSLSSLKQIDVADLNTNFLDYNGDLYTKGRKKLLKYCSGKSDTSFAVPAEVTTIGTNAFNDSDNLVSITLPSGLVSIQMNAFLDCSNLQSINFPQNLQSVGDTAFNYCTSMTELEIPGGVQNFGSGVFANCTSLKRVYISEGIDAVGDSMFYNCGNLAWISIPTSIEEIGSRAFLNCAGLKCVSYEGTEDEWNCITIWDLNDVLNTVDFQFGVDTSIFSYQENIDGTVTITGCLKKSGEVVIPDYIYEMPVKSIGANAFYGSRVTSIVFPKYLESVYANAFEACYGLTDILCPDSLRLISTAAFSNCVNLKNVVLNEGLSEIGAYAFEGCASLKQITIPSTVTTIRDFAFSYSYALEHISVDLASASYSSVDGVLMNKNQTTLIQYPMAKRGIYYIVPEGVTTIGRASFYNSSLEYISLSDQVRFINNEAFKNAGLQRIRLPKSVIFILNDAFLGCSQLKEVYVAKDGNAWAGVTINTGNMALTGANVICYRVAEEEVTITECSTNASGVLNIPKTIENKSVVAIGDGAFEDCAYVTEINLPLCIRNVGAYAFENCASLSSINIPENVELIGQDAFLGCDSLRYDVYYGGNEDSWEKISSSAALSSAAVNYNCVYKSQLVKVFYEGDEMCVTIIPNSEFVGKEIVFTVYKDRKIVDLQTIPYKNEAPVFYCDAPYDEVKIMVWNSLGNLKPFIETDGYHINEL